jgi:hypothetical protein
MGQHDRYRPIRRGFGLGHLFLLMLLIAGALWNGLIPLRFLPFPALDLAKPNSWFIDLRLAALQSDPQQCQAILKPPTIDAHAISDAPYEKGCGWRNAVSFAHAGGAHASIDHMTCETAAALAMWIAHAVQPAAEEYFGAHVTSVHNMGTYACRNILGSKALKMFRSQHARANAIDVSAFVLSDGRTISVAKFWKVTKSLSGESTESKFLHQVHDAACHYFRVTLGPDYNAAHANHFHLDRGAYRTCR